MKCVRYTLDTTGDGSVEELKYDVCLIFLKLIYNSKSQFPLSSPLYQMTSRLQYFFYTFCFFGSIDWDLISVYQGFITLKGLDSVFRFPH